jgi:MFS family permease
LFATNLVNRMGMMGLPFLVIYLTSARGFAPSDVGLVLSIYGLSALLTSPFAGRLSDAVGPVRVMKFFLFSSGVALILFPFASTFPWIIAGTVLWAITGEAFLPASLAVITSVVPSERRRSAFSVNRLAINLGMSIGPAFGGFLLMYSYPLIFWVDGTTSLMAAILVTAAMGRRQISIARAYVQQYQKDHPIAHADVKDVVAHIDHVVKLVGIDHIGIGSDFDGVGDSLPVGLEDVSKYPKLIYGLLNIGYSDEDVKKICSKNLLRVWAQVEKVAIELQTKRGN